MMVRYVSPRSALPDRFTSFPRFDIVLKGVELGSSQHKLTAFWYMEGEKEGLGFAIDPDEQFYEDELLVVADVSAAAKWRPSLGPTLVSAAASWHIPDVESPRSLWSFTLNFESGQSVTLALGGHDEYAEGLTYQPDSVAVIFDEKLAHGYRIPASEVPASGTLIT
jgi:hypothetical protein